MRSPGIVPDSLTFTAVAVGARDVDCDRVTTKSRWLVDGVMALGLRCRRRRPRRLTSGAGAGDDGRKQSTVIKDAFVDAERRPNVGRGRVQWSLRRWFPWATGLV